MSVPNRGDYQYHYMTRLQLENKNLKRRLQDAEDGTGITAEREKRRKEREKLERRIKLLESEKIQMEAAHARDMEKQMRYYMGVMEEIEKEAEARIAQLEKKCSKAWEAAVKAEKAYEDLKEKCACLQEEKSQAQAAAEDLKGQLARQTRTLNQNHENSSIPSSGEGVRKKKIHNSREKSDRSPGAQPGHKGHTRPQPEPTEEPVFVAAAPEIAESGDWELVGSRRKLLADLEVRLKVTPYDFGVYRNRHTGRIVRVSIPDELHDDLNYGPALKAALFLAHTEFNMPARSIVEYMKELSGGTVKVSHGFVAGLTEEFARKSEEERTEIAKLLLAGPYINIDTTTAQCERTRHHVTTNVNGTAAFLSYSEHKGREAAEKTPYAAGYTGCGVHDHEPTFSHYTDKHQLCHAHLIRRLQDVVENEPDRKWAPMGLKLLRQIAHEKKSWPDEGAPASRKKAIRAMYTRMTNTGLREYEARPASKYFREGENLLKALREDREAVLYFLDHPEVPTTNNAAERALRPVKRKQAAAMCWRSSGSLDNYCKAKSVLSTERMNGRSCYEKAVEVMERHKPKSVKSQNEGSTAD